MAFKREIVKEFCLNLLVQIKHLPAFSPGPFFSKQTTFFIIVIHDVEIKLEI